MTSYRLDHGDDLPDWVRQKVDQYLADVVLRFQKIEATYDAAVKGFEAVGVDHVVIKGFSLFPGYTERFGLRPQGDIDLYCPPQVVKRAQGVLSELGYAQNPDHDGHLADHLPIMMPTVPWVPGPNLFDPEMPIGFELHHRFWNEPVMRLQVAGLDDFWNRRIERQIDGFSFRGLHPVDNLGYTALNVLRDLARGLLPIEQVYGLARFLHTHSIDDAFWELWGAYHNPSLRRLEVIPFQLAADWFGCKVHPVVHEETDRLPAGVQAWFRETSKAGLYPRFGQAKDGTWLHVLLLESLSDKLGVLREVLCGVGSKPETVDSNAANQHATEEEPKRSLANFYRRLISYSKWFVSRSAVRIAKFPSFFRLGFRLWQAK